MSNTDADTGRLPVAKTYKLYIGGKFPRTESGRANALRNSAGDVIANVCRASRKDLRSAVVAARAASPGWSSASAYLRGQILYRIAEMLEGRARQFHEELEREGVSAAVAVDEVSQTIDRLIHYAGWADKYVQVLSSINPVASSHFNFSVPEPTGVVGIVAPSAPGLLGLVSMLAPVIAGGNCVVALAPERHPLSSMSFAEVLHASDVPAGVVNLLTGQVEELLPHLAKHMDVNGLLIADATAEQAAEAQRDGAENIKRVIDVTGVDWSAADAEGVYHIASMQETKTTWHPIAN
ncbi:MAG: aldehyde dehydrogenase family protein [Pseudomonadota bacterium]